jgi:dihydrofolate reductase
MAIIVAMDRNGVIGQNGGLPWQDIRDGKWFKEKTLHKSLIMGRATYEAIIARNGQPLDKRTSVVLSTREWNPEVEFRSGTDERGVRWARDPLEALDMASWGWNGGGTTEAIVIGGAQVYEIFLPFANTFFLTLVEGEYKGDRVFPGGVPGLPVWHPVGDPLKFEGFSCHTLTRVTGVS